MDPGPLSEGAAPICSYGFLSPVHPYPFGIAHGAPLALVSHLSFVSSLLRCIILLSYLIKVESFCTKSLFKTSIWLRLVLVAGALLHLSLQLIDSRLSCSSACGILVPPSGMEPVSAALQGGFLTIGPPGMSHTGFCMCWCVIG